ncbi:hypothetical protein JCM8547_002554 [Rhodosporidiobolus lusitaniae]
MWATARPALELASLRTAKTAKSHAAEVEKFFARIEALEKEAFDKRYAQGSFPQYGLISHEPPRWRYRTPSDALSRFPDDAGDWVIWKHRVQLVIEGRGQAAGGGSTYDKAMSELVGQARASGMFNEPLIHDGQTHHFMEEGQAEGSRRPGRAQEARLIVERIHRFAADGLVDLTLSRSADIAGLATIIAMSELVNANKQHLYGRILTELVKHGTLIVENGEEIMGDLEQQGLRVFVSSPGFHFQRLSLPPIAQPQPPSSTAVPTSSLDPLYWMTDLIGTLHSRPAVKGRVEPMQVEKAVELETVSKQGGLEQRSTVKDKEDPALRQYGLVSRDPPVWRYRNTHQLIKFFQADSRAVCQWKHHLELVIKGRPAVSAEGSTKPQAFFKLIAAGRRRGISRSLSSQTARPASSTPTCRTRSILPLSLPALIGGLPSASKNWRTKGVLTLKLSRSILVPDRVRVTASGALTSGKEIYGGILNVLIERGFILLEKGISTFPYFLVPRTHLDRSEVSRALTPMAHASAVEPEMVAKKEIEDGDQEMAKGCVEQSLPASNEGEKGGDEVRRVGGEGQK